MTCAEHFFTEGLVSSVTSTLGKEEKVATTTREIVPSLTSDMGKKTVSVLANYFKLNKFFSSTLI